MKTFDQFSQAMGKTAVARLDDDLTPTLTDVLGKDAPLGRALLSRSGVS